MGYYFRSLSSFSPFSFIFCSIFIALVSSSSTSPQNYYDANGTPTCPQTCLLAGPVANNWTTYSNVNQVLTCNRKPKILDFTIRNLLQDTNTTSVIRACISFVGEDVPRQRSDAIDLLMADATASQVGIELEVSASQHRTDVIVDQIVTAVREIQGSLLGNDETTAASKINSTTLFVHYGDTVVGVYVGGRLSKKGIAAGPLQSFLDRVTSQASMPPRSALTQLCGEGRDSDFTFGAMIDTTLDTALFSVQHAVMSWSNSNCNPLLDGVRSVERAVVWTTAGLEILVDGTLDRNQTFHSSVALSANTTLSRRGVGRAIEPRADCRTLTVVSGDGCASLASKCGISGNTFTAINSQPNFCATLQVGQRVCCSPGSLPDVRPKPQSDGTCASYLVSAGDWCAKIATANGLTVQDLEDYNQNTWGWSGCNSLFAGSRMCISKGDPPMPASIPNAICGPQKPGTRRPMSGFPLEGLNECPLKACCNVWGQCGTTAAFCTKAPLKAPGTSQPGKNSCISNCGTDIPNRGTPPFFFLNIGYYEAWNSGRPCLHMVPSQLPSSYTHIHFAFAAVTASFEVSLAGVQSQFDAFVQLKSGPRKVIAFGGWTASTDPSSFNIFRNGVKPENREKLTSNLANFINSQNVDGIDLDWEYPGAPDIPGIPPADVIDGPNYLAMLKLLKSKLNPGKSMSIAAPASYWYLKDFPIAEIAGVVDYIVYMTYDLHGQWDYGNAWSSPGCPDGNCLRSHVNVTETMNALSMITKAGVPGYKIMVGVTSYGRSFKMTTPGCEGPQCTFVGPQSAAKPGRCTQTAGYISNAEIEEIIKTNPSARTSRIDNSDVLVYDNTEWVSYMSAENKQQRTAFWKAMNFGGTSEWAIDLAEFVADTPATSAEPLTIGSDAAWASMKCPDDSATDQTVNSKERWVKFGADKAWEWVLSQYKSQKPKLGENLTFPEWVSHLLSGKEAFKCGSLSVANNCVKPDCAGNLTPAGYLILSSFNNINSLYQSLYDGVTDAAEDFSHFQGQFSKTFAPTKKKDASLDWLMDFVDFGLGLAGGKVLGAAFRGLSDLAADSLKEAVLKGVSWGVESLKNQDFPRLTESADAEIGAAFGFMFEMWKDRITAINQQTFNGTDEGIAYLSALLQDGKSVNLHVMDRADVDKIFRRIFYAHMIPLAWTLRDHKVALMDSGTNCDTVGGGDYKWVMPKDKETASVCDGGKMFFLLSPDGTQRDCENLPHDVVHCNNQTMSVPPGLDSLDGKAWGGITKSTISSSVRMHFQLQANQGLDKPADMTSQGALDAMYRVINDDSSVGLPAGIVNLPTCPVAEAFKHWTSGEDQDYPSYPCNRN